MLLTYKHIKWGLISKLLVRPFSWHLQISGTLKLVVFHLICSSERPSPTVPTAGGLVVGIQHESATLGGAALLI